MVSHRLSKFEILIGTWNTSGDVVATKGTPAGQLLATDTYRWLPGKHFIIHEADARFGSDPARSMEVIGYDSASKKFISRSFDDRGVSEVFEMTLEGRRWSIMGEAMRFEGKFNVAGNKLAGLWELKNKEGSWQPWIKLRLERV